MSTKKVLFVGNACTYKTRMAHLLTNIQSEPGYVPTQGAQVYTYIGSSGTTYNIWDCGGQASLAGFRDGYYINADTVIIFTGGNETRNHPEWGNMTPADWKKLVTRVCPGIKIHYIHNARIDRLRLILA